MYRKISLLRLFKVFFWTPMIFAWCCLVCVCTKSPLGDDDLGEGNISAGLRSMRGLISMNDGTNPDHVCVWMDILGLSTSTDSDGNFILTLPDETSHVGSIGMSGFYRIFFYMANYLLDSAQVIVNESEFVYGNGDIDREGYLYPSKVLEKFLDFETSIDPLAISASYDSLITVNILFRATIDDALVHFPEGRIKIREGTVFLRNMDSSWVSQYQTTITDIDTKSDFLAVKSGEPSLVTMEFSIVNDPLPPGRYEVIPFFIPYYKDTLEGFIEKVFPDYDIPSLDYLDIPMKRKGGSFEVTN